ncbi:hypothetical protein L3X38_013151 [Prunus dulcis]|uniref:Uncharacterized protein n=1 Tax=Prunus dulcis TaxID=3755 RepID=A0AAD4WMC6_PRUDU|nr:hypothetical protein L3X38_013151 [Prunus dulcis]
MMNISPRNSSSAVICYINHQQLFINFAAQQQQTSNRRHGNKSILPFTISMILTLVQMRYGQEDLFETHHFLMVVVLSSVLTYCLASLLGRLLLVMRPSVSAGTASDEHDCHAYTYKWCHIIMLLFGSLSVASLVWLLIFPYYSFWPPVLYLVLIFLFSLVVGLALKLVPVVCKFLSLVCRGQNGVRRTRPLLPLSTVDLSQR